MDIGQIIKGIWDTFVKIQRIYRDMVSDTKLSGFG